MNIVACDAQHVGKLTGLFGGLSERDLTLIKEDLTDSDAVRAWAGRPGQQWVALDGSDIVGYAAVRTLPEALEATPEALVTAGDFRLVGSPIRIAGYEPKFRPPPMLDEHGAIDS